VLAHKKVSNGWGETLVRAIFANWLVCIATWQANAAQDLTGKAVAIWLPISAFAMLGFEHCIGECPGHTACLIQGRCFSLKRLLYNGLQSSQDPASKALRCSTTRRVVIPRVVPA
jgi:formate/nitrite transporter FocA (FNT family)